MIGRTNSDRVLTIVLRILPDLELIPAITGWGSTCADNTRYRRQEMATENAANQELADHFQAHKDDPEMWDDAEPPPTRSLPWSC